MTSYITLQEAQDYFDCKVETKFWDLADDTTRQKALNQATKIIDALNFVGMKVDDSQEHEFPRQYMVPTENTDGVLVTETLPQGVKDACAEIALSLLGGIDPESEYRDLRTVSQGFGQVRSQQSSEIIPEHIPAGVPSYTAWRLLKPYLCDSQSVTLKRV